MDIKEIICPRFNDCPIGSTENCEHARPHNKRWDCEMSCSNNGETIDVGSCNAQQIHNLYKPPEEVLLSDEERNEAIDSAEIQTCGDERKALCKAQLNKVLSHKIQGVTIQKLIDWAKGGRLALVDEDQSLPPASICEANNHEKYCHIREQHKMLHAGFGHRIKLLSQLKEKE